jgi:hypothetical protein
VSYWHAAGLAIALITLVVAIRSIQRRRAALRAGFIQSPTGAVIVAILNMGPKPVRIDKIIRREGWIRGRNHDFSAWSRSMDSNPLPVIVAPQHQVLVPIHNVEMYATRGRWFLVDANGGRHAIESDRRRVRPPGRVAL